MQTQDEHRHIGPVERLVVIRSVEKSPRTWYVLTNASKETPLVAVVQEAYARAKDRFAGGGRNDPATFEWPALRRKLDRIDPSYKQ